MTTHRQKIIEIFTNLFALVILGVFIATWFFHYDPPFLFILIADVFCFCLEFHTWKQDKTRRNLLDLALWTLIIILNIITVIIR